METNLNVMMLVVKLLFYDFIFIPVLIKNYIKNINESITLKIILK